MLGRLLTRPAVRARGFHAAARLGNEPPAEAKGRPARMAVAENGEEYPVYERIEDLSALDQKRFRAMVKENPHADITRLFMPLPAGLPDTHRVHFMDAGLAPPPVPHPLLEHPWAAGLKAARAQMSPAVPYTVTPAWLRENLNAPGVRVLDASYYPQNYYSTEDDDYWSLDPWQRENVEFLEEQDPVQEFAKGAIPGASLMDLRLFSDPLATTRNLAPIPADFQLLCSDLGLRQTDHIVVYDKDGIYSSPRAAYLFKMFGHEKVSVLDGGLPAWREAGFETVPGSAPPKVGSATEMTYGEVTIDRDIVMHQKIVHAHLVSTYMDPTSKLLVDARPYDRHTGLRLERNIKTPAGTIPTSLSLPFTEVLTPDGRHFLDIEPLLKKLWIRRMNPDEGFIIFSGTSITSSLVWWALRHHGFQNITVYDGGIADWTNRRAPEMVLKDMMSPEFMRMSM